MTPSMRQRDLSSIFKLYFEALGHTEVQKARAQLPFRCTNYIGCYCFNTQLTQSLSVTRQFYLNMPFNHHNNLISPDPFTLQILKPRFKVTSASRKTGKTV